MLEVDGKKRRDMGEKKWTVCSGDRRRGERQVKSKRDRQLMLEINGKRDKEWGRARKGPKEKIFHTKI